MTDRPSAPAAHLAILLGSLLVAGSFLASASLSGTISPFSLTLLRFVLASLLLAPFALAGAPRRRRLLPTLPRAAVMSFFYAAFFACMFQALESTTALNTSALYTLVPFLTALLARALLRQRLTARDLGVYAVGTAATCWVVFRGDVQRLAAFSLEPGDPLFLLGTLLMCGYSLAIKTLDRGDDRLVLVFAILLTGSLWMGLGLVLAGEDLAWRRLSSGDALAMAYLVLGATLSTVPLYQFATVTLGPRRVMAYTYLSPGLVALLALAIDGTPIAPAIWPGLALTLVATALLQREARPGATPPVGPPAAPKPYREPVSSDPMP